MISPPSLFYLFTLIGQREIERVEWVRKRAKDVPPVGGDQGPQPGVPLLGPFMLTLNWLAQMFSSNPVPVKKLLLSLFIENIGGKFYTIS